MIPVCPDGMPFIDFARDRLPGWRKEAEGNLERYREKLRMREIIEHMLDVTVYGHNLSSAPTGPIAFVPASNGATRIEASTVAPVAEAQARAAAVSFNLNSTF
jgi:hypothetical protein